MTDKILTRLNRSIFGHPDRLSGSVLMVVAAVALVDAYNLPFGSLRHPDSGFFPKSLSVLLFVFALAIVVSSFLKNVEPAEFSSRSWLVAIAAAAFIAYALVLPVAGFVLSTIAIMLLVMRGLGGMKWTQAVLIAVLSVGLSYAGFLQLGVPLPRGPLPF